MEKVAILLLGYGAPASPEEAKTFVKNLVWEISRREVSDEALEETQKKYNAIGGSPYLEICQKQKELLENFLRNKLSVNLLAVKLAFRYCSPSFSQVLSEIKLLEPDNLFLLSLPPFPSPYGSTGYFEKIKVLLNELNFPCQLFFLHDWSESRLFFQAWKEIIVKNLEKIPDELKSQTQIVFTFHSLPLKVAQSFPEYLESIKKATSRLENQLKFKGEIAFQSGKEEGWLEPSLKAVIDKIAQEGKKVLFIVPLGFIADQLETLYDLDIEAKSKAEEVGLKFFRVKALNDSPLLIQAFGESILKRIN